jgi:AcrR family transcriptional regulator
VLEKSAKQTDPTRERILEAALDLFGERGLNGATVRDIAARAKVNVAAISYHFGGKEELYRAVAETVIGALAGRVRARVGWLLTAPPRDPESAMAALEELFTTFVDVIVGPEEMRRVARFVIREQMQPTSAFEVLFSMLSEFHGLATRIFATATGGDADSDETKLRVFMIFGQVLIFRIAEPAVLRRLKRDRYDAALLDRIKSDIRQNVRVVVAAARERK